MAAAGSSPRYVQSRSKSSRVDRSCARRSATAYGVMAFVAARYAASTAGASPRTERTSSSRSSGSLARPFASSPSAPSCSSTASRSRRSCSRTAPFGMFGCSGTRSTSFRPDPGVGRSSRPGPTGAVFRKARETNHRLRISTRPLIPITTAFTARLSQSIDAIAVASDRATQSIVTAEVQNSVQTV